LRGQFDLASRNQFFSRSHQAVIRVYDDADNVTETHEHAGDFKEGVAAANVNAKRNFASRANDRMRMASRAALHSAAGFRVL
jgi:hypothetical protein